MPYARARHSGTLVILNDEEVEDFEINTYLYFCLWQQNEEVVTRMGKYTGITTACTATAETSSHLYSSRREKIVDQVVIGTPGTLKRWMTRDKALDTRHIKILVFDEADQMLDQVCTLLSISYSVSALIAWLRF